LGPGALGDPAHEENEIQAAHGGAVDGNYKKIFGTRRPEKGPEKMIMMTIEEPIHSGNVILRSHYRERMRILEVYEWMILAALHDTGHRMPDEAPQHKMKIRITSYRARYLDPDRLYAGATLLVDAIKKMRLIKDDSPHWLTLRVDQEIDSKNMRTKIRIEKFRKKEKINERLSKGDKMDKRGDRGPGGNDQGPDRSQADPL
jgi:hypothetical protein